MLLVLSLLIIPPLFGVSVLAWAKIMAEKISLLLVGTIGGLAVSTTLTYVVSLGRPLTSTLLVIEVILLLVATLFFLYRGAWNYWRSLPLDKVALGVLLGSLALCLLIVPKLLIAKDDGLYTGIVNAYGDIAWHTANITMFSAGQSVPPENPIFAGTRLTYPFLSNFFSGMLLSGGSSLAGSVVYPAIILIPLILTLFYCLVRNYSVGNKTAGIIAVLLLLFGGATFGWIRFGSDFTASNLSLAQFVTHLPMRDYSGVGTDANGFHFLNPITSLLLPQRSFLFGLPLALAIVLLLQPSGRRSDKHFLLAGVLAGLLPLFHAHTVLVMIPVIIGLFLLSPGLHWLLFFLTAGIIGIPEVLYYAGGQQAGGSFIRWGPGWMAGTDNWLWYWLKNTGLLIPLGVAGLFTSAPRTLKALAISGLLLLIAGNTFLFAPWAWDNFKILVFWLIFSLPLISWMAAQILKRSQPIHWRGAVVLLIVLHTLSGSLDIWKLLLPTATVWGEWDKEGIAMAEEIKGATKRGASIITAPIHNSPVVLAGRPRYLGYAAHVWSHGGLPWDREEALGRFYQGEINSLPDFTPGYVLVGPAERAQFGPILIRPAWQLVASTANYQLFKIPVKAFGESE